MPAKLSHIDNHTQPAVHMLVPHRVCLPVDLESADMSPLDSTLDCNRICMCWQDITNLTWPAVQTRLPYHVRVLVPCYKEDLEILRRTVLAAHDAILPNGCQRTIYMCDDGKDPKKRKW